MGLLKVYEVTNFMTLFFRVLMLGITIFVIVLMKYDRKKSKPVEDKMLANNTSAEFRPITSSELFYADILYSRLKSYYIKFFGIGLIIDAFFVYGMVTNSDREAVAKYGMNIALISIIVLHLTISYCDFCVLKQMRLGEYKVLVGTLIDKRKVRGYRTKISYFTIRDDGGVDRVYQGIPKGEYDEAEPGRRCMIFKFNKDKSNTPANITKHVVLM